MKTKVVAVTAPTVRHEKEDRTLTAEEFIAFAARVSNPSNQHNHETAAKLLAYCIMHGHWSVFETVSMTVEIETSRAIAAQLLRHRSFTFQEFSQRYAASASVEKVDLRWQDKKNRQASGDPVTDLDLYFEVSSAIDNAFSVYNTLLAKGVSRETARMVLPLATTTTMYMTGSVRSWIHYLEQRTHESTQKEHRDVALEIKGHFARIFPTVASLI